MRELYIDSFAGGGGASCGGRMALGHDPDHAINHDPIALAIHQANHPGSQHWVTNIQGLHPLTVTRGAPVGLLWASPDCVEFSHAKGGAPRRMHKRDLACAVILWAQIARPRVIMLENVREFEKYGPAGGFEPWVEKLRKLGYRVEWRDLVGADYGATTTRKRLFLIARCDGEPIVWPDASHGGRWPQAWEIIDWSLPIYSIFMGPHEAKNLGIKRPLKPNTLARIARGVKKYVLETPKPFIVPVTHAGDRRVHGLDEPLRTITGANRGELSVVSPFFVDRYGERPGQEPRCRSVEGPLSTIVPTANGAQLCAAFLAQHNGGVVGHSAVEPVSTITARGSQQQLVASHLLKLRNNCYGSSLEAPLDTLAAQGCHFGEVRAFLAKYYKTATGSDLREPLHTITGTDRFGLVTTYIGGEEWVLYDIAMRMLAARELYLAQGFPRDYIIDPIYNGKPISKTQQVEAVGNSVCPQIAEALIRANVQLRDVEPVAPDFGELFAEVA